MELDENLVKTIIFMYKRFGIKKTIGEIHSGYMKVWYDRLEGLKKATMNMDFESIDKFNELMKELE